jgi:hypothetical protein
MEQVVLVPLEAAGNYVGCVGEYAGIAALANGVRAAVMSGGAAAPEGAAGGAIVGGITGAFKCAGIP